MAGVLQEWATVDYIGLTITKSMLEAIREFPSSLHERSDGSFMELLRPSNTDVIDGGSVLTAFYCPPRHKGMGYAEGHGARHVGGPVG